MQLNIDGKIIQAEPEQSLKALVAKLGLDAPKLSQRPLAARIAGEVFTLNYIPLREKDGEGDRPSMRRAMAASGGNIKLLRYGDSAGKEVYIRTAQFLMFLAFQQLWPKARAVVGCTLGSSVYVTVEGAENFSAERLKKHIQELVARDIPLLRRRVSREEAIARYAAMGRQDKARLLSWRSLPYCSEYTHGDYTDSFFGEMAPSTGYLTVWDVLSADGGFLFVFPDDLDPARLAKLSPMPQFFSVFSEGERWCRLMECQNAADLNDLTVSGRIRELIRVNEALHEKRFAQAADLVSSRGARVVLLAGPSSSGKTTSAHRLATQLRVYGKKPVLMSLDDYYIDGIRLWSSRFSGSNGLT